MINASYQVKVHVAKRFQRKILKCEKGIDDGRQVMAEPDMVFGQLNYELSKRSHDGTVNRLAT
jgi:hypothetical protein